MIFYAELTRNYYAHIRPDQCLLAQCYLVLKYLSCEQFKKWTIIEFYFLFILSRRAPKFFFQGGFFRSFKKNHHYCYYQVVIIFDYDYCWQYAVKIIAFTVNRFEFLKYSIFFLSNIPVYAKGSFRNLIFLSWFFVWYHPRLVWSS